jgi:hypothetical protein
MLITDSKAVVLEMGHDGKFSAKSNVWEDNKVLLEGEDLVIRVVGAAGSSPATGRRTGADLDVDGFDTAGTDAALNE